ncbi:calcium-binding protein [Pseudomonas sp. GW6]|uniref:Hemolysin-type calcium-binding repeat-containing protein n=1 Tax=Pseudomonas sihuiensis TaxID=1274359 RepID=A0A1H2N6Z9_9PSED|nr:calcium-binding protein [Pseudomonas sihuiensis]SDV00566.1 Hemolysin-type calcium-binding repeat-containing protein [Pseudomonas sihuiensis]
MAIIKTNDNFALLTNIIDALNYSFNGNANNGYVDGITGALALQAYQLETRKVSWARFDDYNPFVGTPANLSAKVLYRYDTTKLLDENKKHIGWVNGSREIKLTDSNHSSSYNKLSLNDNYATKNIAGQPLSQTTIKNNANADIALARGYGSDKSLSITKAKASYSNSETSINGSQTFSDTINFVGQANYQSTGALQTLTINTYNKTHNEKLTEKSGATQTTSSYSYSLSLSSQLGLTYDALTGTFKPGSKLDSLKFNGQSLYADGMSNSGSYQASAMAQTTLDELADYLSYRTISQVDLLMALLSGDDVITGTDKRHNWLFGGAGNDKITGNAGSDELYGGDGDDQLFGLAGDDQLYGGAGNDLLDGGKGLDIMVGGDGDDLYVLDDIRELEWINRDHENTYYDAGNDTLRITFKGSSNSAPAVIDLSAVNLLEVENVQIASSGLFEIIGNDANNVLDAGKTASILRGGKGNDTYHVTHRDAQVHENAGEGWDTVISSVHFTLGANLEELILTGRAALNGTGNALNNILRGNDGNNILDGGAGIDTLIGGKGNDTYIVRNIGDIVEENDKEGTDTAKAHVSYELTDHVENLILEGSDHLDGTGNGLKNVITGNSGNNVLDGKGGVDRMIGGKGDDTYIVDLIVKGTGTKATVALEDSIVEKKGEGEDTLQLRVSQDVLDKMADASKATTLILGANLENLDASDTQDLWLNLTGNALNNVIRGNAGDNILSGGAGDDTLYAGEGGKNVLIGGAGADIMHGGAGDDTFRFTSLKDLGIGEGKQDVIHGFNEAGVDKLDFSALKGWSFKEDGVITGTKQLWAAHDGSDLILYGNSSGNLDADFSIKLVGVSALSVDDFIV